MIHLRTRSDFIEFIQVAAPYPAVRRAILQDGVEVLGTFGRTHSIDRAVMLARVTSRAGKSWIVVLKFWPSPNVIIKTEDDIDWSAWLGNEHPGKFMAGDKPYLYEDLKWQSQKSSASKKW